MWPRTPSQAVPAREGTLRADYGLDSTYTTVAHAWREAHSPREPKMCPEIWAIRGAKGWSRRTARTRCPVPRRGESPSPRGPTPSGRGTDLANDHRAFPRPLAGAIHESPLHRWDPGLDLTRRVLPSKDPGVGSSYLCFLRCLRFFSGSCFSFSAAFEIRLGASDGVSKSSMRRFFARPEEVRFLAMGWYSP